jgi:hypothetical protein
VRRRADAENFTGNHSLEKRLIHTFVRSACVSGNSKSNWFELSLDTSVTSVVETVNLGFKK